MTHPITPPPELVMQWSDIKPMEDAVVQNWVKIAAKAAQWGWNQRSAATEAELQQRADQELEACCEWIRGWYGSGCGELINELRAARRPKPPSLKKQAYAALDTYIYGEPDPKDKERTYNIIRHALERLKELEGQ